MLLDNLGKIYTHYSNSQGAVSKYFTYNMCSSFDAPYLNFMSLRFGDYYLSQFKCRLTLIGNTRPFPSDEMFLLSFDIVQFFKDKFGIDIVLSQVVSHFGDYNYSGSGFDLPTDRCQVTVEHNSSTFNKRHCLNAWSTEDSNIVQIVPTTSSLDTLEVGFFLIHN